MTKLTDTQRIILSAASQRTDSLALPLPKSLKGGAVIKVIKPLIEKGLLEEVDANRKLNDPVWRETGDGHAVTLIITDAGLEAIGVEPDTGPQAATRGEETDEVPAAPAEASGQPAPAAAPRERKTREGTKQALVIEMLRRPEGASIAEIVEATGWLSHTARGVLAGSLKKKLGLAIDSEKHDTRGRIYKFGA
jgi:hypothetical protein